MRERVVERGLIGITYSRKFQMVKEDKSKPDRNEGELCAKSSGEYFMAIGHLFKSQRK